jgi:hypothetical protein
MLASTYDAELYRAPSSAPTYDDADFGERAFANGWSMYDPEPASFVTDYGDEVPF